MGTAAAPTQTFYLNCIEAEGHALNDLLCKRLPPKLLVVLAASSPLEADPKILLHNALASQKMNGMTAAGFDQQLNSQHFTHQSGPYQNRHLGFERVL